jgi:Prohead core protein serine protease
MPWLSHRLVHDVAFGRQCRWSPAGLFARANCVNTNNRLYPKQILLREVKKFIEQRVQMRCALGELDHPSYSSPTFKHLNLVNISHQVLSVKWKGNALWGFIEVRCLCACDWLRVHVQRRDSQW